MKQFHIHALIVLMFSTLFLGGMNAFAQDAAEKANVKKELSKVMKDLPEDVQVQILRYAQRKRDALKAAQAKQLEAEAKTAIAQPVEKAQQEMATPQPKPAQPAAIEVAPSSPASVATPDPKPVPAVPTYIQEAKEMAETNLQFEDEAYNYGKVETGTVVTHTFKFKNTGTEPLKLTRVKASCGCTTPKWSQEPVQPGAEGFIDVSFNSTGKVGVQTKTITVTGNFPGNNKVLRISGEVLPKPVPEGN
ncbi:MAG: DUF1573 domain-containing protein [Bacteroidia bacterium]